MLSTHLCQRSGNFVNSSCPLLEEVKGMVDNKLFKGIFLCLSCIEFLPYQEDVQTLKKKPVSTGLVSTVDEENFQP